MPPYQFAKGKKSARKVAASRFLRFSLWLMLLFFAHRWLSFEDLSFGEPGIFFPKAISIGLASDLWVAVCLALAATLISLPISRYQRALRWFYLSLAIFFSLLVAGHQYYVSFFKHPILPVHLSYLIDLDFMEGDGFAALQNKAFIALFLGGSLAWVLIFSPSGSARRLRFGKHFALALILVGVAAHVLHNRYKEQWFIPNALRYNPFENLLYLSLSQRYPNDLSAPEAEYLQKHLAYAEDPTPQVRRWNMLPQALAIKESLTKKREDGRPLYLIVVTMESLRMADFSSDLTPELFALAQDGILFERAYATGNITRGAQEALFCGVSSGVNYSYMRREISLPLQCLTQETEIRNIHNFWYHGGHPSFDRQLAFWHSQGIPDTLSLDDFDSQTPRTGWGVGDLSFFRVAMERILQLEQNASPSLNLGMLLTVSNHIPWQVPQDIEANWQELNAPEAFANPSYRTVKYSDAALGEWISKLKSSGLWDRTFLIITGDHGHLMPAFRQDYQGNKQDLLSHVPLILGGGLIPDMAADLNFETYLQSQVVHHAQVPGLLAFLLNMEHLSFAFPPLLSNEERPSFVNLGETFYFPRTSEAISREDLFQKEWLDAGSDSEKTLEKVFAKNYFLELKKRQLRR
jgi:phosphoglycerol transferase MdoB-like AlkP superfamily enzyme